MLERWYVEDDNAVDLQQQVQAGHGKDWLFEVVSIQNTLIHDAQKKNVPGLVLHWASVYEAVLE